MAKKDIDAHEREFGADGTRAFGNENMEESTNKSVDDDIKPDIKDTDKVLTEVESGLSIRTVADALHFLSNNESDVSDKEIDRVWFMNYEENPTDSYDRVQNYIAEHTKFSSYSEGQYSGVIIGDFYSFCDKNLPKFKRFMSKNCIVRVLGKNKDDDIENCLRVIEDLCIGNYSERQYKEFLDIFTSNNSITEDAEDDVKKIKINKSWKSYMTYDGKKIDRVLSSTETDSDGNEYHVAKLFFGKAPDSVVLTGDEAEKYINHWKQYADDPDKYKEYADKQGRYVRIHEGGERCE